MSLSHLKLTATWLIRTPLSALKNRTQNCAGVLIGQTVRRHFCVPPADAATPVVEKKFVNRNPRNLEFLGIAWRRLGWKFHYPSREFYHRVVFDRTKRHTAAYVEHCSGKIVISVSTKEMAVARHLYSTSDTAAAVNIGRILAQRCHESGITSMVLGDGEAGENSEKFAGFQKALLDGGIELSEPSEVVPHYEPGIDYSNQEELDDLFRRQRLVKKLGPKSTIIKNLREKTYQPERKRPKAVPTPLEAPSYTFT